MVICFSGIVLVLLAGSSSSDTDDVSLDNDDKMLSGYQLGVLLCFCCVLIFSTSAVATRKLKGVHFLIIIFNLGIVQIVMSSIWLLIET